MTIGVGAELPKDVLLDLRLTPLFSGVAEADLRDLLAEAVVERHGDGAVLMCQGEAAERFHVLLDGHVELYVTAADGKRSVIEILQKRAVFGEAAIFDSQPRHIGAAVIDSATVVMVPAAGFLAKLNRRFDLVLLMLGSMSFRLRVLVRQIAELKLKTTAQRLGGFLLSLTEVATGEATVRFPYDKKVVADKLGMKPESLSRALARLGPVGVRSQADNVVRITDVAKLRRFCIEEGMD
ncbi:MAG: cyclic nucleotide-binding domain-containing protein [Rhodospirillales bacterium]|nr:cyclic nucleotide-binding domain-containing protein [Rhodospirillales bacterium]